MNILEKMIAQVSFRAGRNYRKLKSKNIIARYLRDNNVIKINLGCGANPFKGWLNCDLDPVPGVCFVDCREKLPFPDKAVDYIYSEHLIEHFSLSECINFLKESYRILKASGRIRLATPNLESFLDMYKGSSDSKIYLGWYKNRKRADEPLSLVNCINSIFYEHGHKFIYDYDYLKRLMEDCQFKEVQRCEIHKSSDTAFNDLEQHGKVIGDTINEIESLAVEAGK